MLITYITFSIILVLLITMEIRFKEFGLPLLMLMVLPVFLQMISLMVINKGMYVMELNKETYNNNSVILYFLFVLIFISTFWVCLVTRSHYYRNRIQSIEYISELSNSKYSRSVNIFLNIIIWLVVYMYLDMAIHGIPLLNKGYGLKQDYFTTTAHLPLAGSLYSVIFLYVPGVIGYALLLFWQDKPKRKKTIAIVVMMILYNILLGYKASGLTNIVLYTLLPVSIVFLKNTNLSIRKLSRKTLKLILGIILYMVAIISIILFNYVHTVAAGTDIISFFFQRVFGLSNHLFWAAKTYRDGNMSSLGIGSAFTNLYNEISAIWIQPSSYDARYGIAKLMTYLGNPDTVKWYLPRGVRMGGSFITVFYFNCGIGITCLLCVAFSYLFERVFEIYINALSRKSILELILSTKILYSFYSFIWNSGSIGDFFTFVNIIIMLILLILQSLAPIRLKLARKSYQ